MELRGDNSPHPRLHTEENLSLQAKTSYMAYNVITVLHSDFTSYTVGFSSTDSNSDSKTLP